MVGMPWPCLRHPGCVEDALATAGMPCLSGDALDIVRMPWLWWGCPDCGGGDTGSHTQTPSAQLSPELTAGHSGSVLHCPVPLASWWDQEEPETSGSALCQTQLIVVSCKGTCASASQFSQESTKRMEHCTLVVSLYPCLAFSYQQ